MIFFFLNSVLKEKARFPQTLNLFFVLRKKKKRVENHFYSVFLEFILDDCLSSHKKKPN